MWGGSLLDCLARRLVADEEGSTTRLERDLARPVLEVRGWGREACWSAWTCYLQLSNCTEGRRVIFVKRFLIFFLIPPRSHAALCMHFQGKKRRFITTHRHNIFSLKFFFFF